MPAQNSIKAISTKPNSAAKADPVEPSANNNSVGVNSEELDLEEASYKSGRVDSSLKSVTPKSEMVTVKTAVRQRTSKPKPPVKPKPTILRRKNLKLFQNQKDLKIQLD